ncbi:heparin lyase I family protein [Salinicola lusitanus]|uniref:Heparin lyase I family protein n=1 Tax=Salinicola lusitanus TaxID=1949085 RepID=A0ABZ3CPI2_9GAMM
MLLRFVLATILVFLPLTFSNGADQYFIQRADSCNSDMGSGGNLKGTAIPFQGKCEGAGLSPKLIKNQGILFRVSTKGSSDRDRSELAATSKPFYLDRPYYVGFEIKVPRDSDVSDDFFYLLQFWQGGNKNPPIAGLRMKRGQSHVASIMVRGPNNPRGNTISTINLQPRKWHHIVLGIQVNSDGTGWMEVWKGHKISSKWQGRIGFSTEPGVNDWYRLKFGIYKKSEPGRQFSTIYKNIKIGDSFRSVSF